MSEQTFGVLCAGPWGRLLVPWSKITTVAYEAEGGEPQQPVVPGLAPLPDGSWQATGVPREERESVEPVIRVPAYDRETGAPAGEIVLEGGQSRGGKSAALERERKGKKP